MDKGNMAELNPDQLPRPKPANWYVAGEEGVDGFVAVTSGTHDDKNICIVGGGTGSGGAIPDEYVSWDAFTALTQAEQAEIVASPLGIKPPETLLEATMYAARAFIRPYDGALAEHVYDTYQDALQLPAQYTRHFPVDTEDRIRRDDISFEVATTELGAGVYFTRRMSITAFDEQNDRGYYPNLRLDPLTMATINRDNHRILPIDIGSATNHAPAETIEGYWPQADAPHIAGMVDRIDSWLQLAQQDETVSLASTGE